jgi:hypothetical protein
MKRLVIVADLGRLRMFRVVRDRRGHRARNLMEVKVPQPVGEGRSVYEKVTDQAGRFPRGGGGMAYGEAHEMEAEQERKKVRALRREIEALLEAEECDSWNLAVPASIRSMLLGGMPLQVLERLTRVVDADLTKLPLEKLRERFVPG